jgi:subtilisin-like proprotein convertase family protein
MFRQAPPAPRIVARLLLAAFPVCALYLGVASAAGAVTYSNSGTIVINDATDALPRDIAAKATPYPSDISVSGFIGPVTGVTATVQGFHHSCPQDVDVLLVGPQGQKTILMSEAGDCTQANTPHDPINLTFVDGAPPLPCVFNLTAPLAGGTYSPTDGPTSPDDCTTDDTDPDIFDPPAPAGPYPASMAVFNGVDPNGAWQLYVMDQFSADSGAIDGGWSLNLTVPPPTVGAPTITGAAELGKTLTANSGAITNGGVPSYQWNRCNLAGAACAAIAGANKSTYVPTTADKGHTLIVTETASNSGGSASANSTPTSGVGPPNVTSAGTKKTQRVLKQRGLVVFATSNIAGRLTAGATVRVRNAAKIYRFKSVRKTLAAGVKTRAKLKLSKRGLRAVRNALNRRQKLKAKLRLTVTDLNGGKTTTKLSIRLRK